MFLENLIVEAIQTGICLMKMNKMLDVELSCVMCYMRSNSQSFSKKVKGHTGILYMGVIGDRFT